MEGEAQGVREAGRGGARRRAPGAACRGSAAGPGPRPVCVCGCSLRSREPEN